MRQPRERERFGVRFSRLASERQTDRQKDRHRGSQRVSKLFSLSDKPLLSIPADAGRETYQDHPTIITTLTWRVNLTHFPNPHPTPLSLSHTHTHTLSHTDTHTHTHKHTHITPIQTFSHLYIGIHSDKHIEECQNALTQTCIHINPYTYTYTLTHTHTQTHLETGTTPLFNPLSVFQHL